MAFKRIFGIAACDPRGVIGKNGKIPWRCPEDLKHFSDTILQCPIIMGHSTFLSLPARYFEGRTTIVFSRQQIETSKYPNIYFVSSICEFLALEGSFKDLYCVGGAQIYNLFLKENLIHEFILTRLKSYHEGDTFFSLSLFNGWPSLKVQETPIFSIYRYFNPLEPTYAYKNI